MRKSQAQTKTGIIGIYRVLEVNLLKEFDNG